MPACTSTPNFHIYPLLPETEFLCESPLCVLHMPARYEVRFDDGQAIRLCPAHGDAVKWLYDALLLNRTVQDRPEPGVMWTQEIETEPVEDV